MRKSKPAVITEATVLSVFTARLDELKWSYRYSEDKRKVNSGFNSPELLWDFTMFAHDRGDGQFLLCVNSYIPCKALAERRAACSELLNRINYELLVGCFELNFAEGNIMFRTSVSLPGVDITPGIVAELLRSNLMIVGEQYHRIAAVLYGGKTPEAAMKPKAEKPAVDPTPRFSMN